MSYIYDMLNSSSPVESLSCLCAVIISDDFTDVPVKPIIQFSHTSLENDPTNGELTILASRVTLLGMEKYFWGRGRNQEIISESEWASYLRPFFSLMSSRKAQLIRFSGGYTLIALQENISALLDFVLRSSDIGIRMTAPSAESQLEMIEYIINSAIGESAISDCSQFVTPMRTFLFRGPHTTEYWSRLCTIACNFFQKCVLSCAPANMDHRWDELFKDTIDLLTLLVCRGGYEHHDSVQYEETRRHDYKRPKKKTKISYGENIRETIANIVLIPLFEMIATIKFDVISVMRGEKIINAAIGLAVYCPNVTVQSISTRRRQNLLAVSVLLLESTLAASRGSTNTLMDDPFQNVESGLIGGLLGPRGADGPQFVTSLNSIKTASGITVSLVFIHWVLGGELGNGSFSPRYTWTWRRHSFDSYRLLEEADSDTLTEAFFFSSAKSKHLQRSTVDFVRMMQISKITGNEQQVRVLSIPAGWSGPTNSMGGTLASSSLLSVTELELLIPPMKQEGGAFSSQSLVSVKKKAVNILCRLLNNPSTIKESHLHRISNSSTIPTDQANRRAKVVERDFYPVVTQLLCFLALDSASSDPETLVDILRNFVRANATKPVAALSHYFLTHSTINKNESVQVLSVTGSIKLLESTLKKHEALSEANPPPTKKRRVKRSVSASNSSDGIVYNLRKLLHCVSLFGGKGSSTFLSFNETNTKFVRLLMTFGKETSPLERKSASISFVDLLENETSTSIVALFLPIVQGLMSDNAMQTTPFTSKKGTSSAAHAAEKEKVNYLKALTNILQLPPPFENISKKVARIVLDQFLECFVVMQASNPEEMRSHNDLGAISAGLAQAVPSKIVLGERSPKRCSKGHRLKLHQSTTWTCDICFKGSSYPSLGCRRCDYDICQTCAVNAFGGERFADPSMLAMSYIRGSSKDEEYLVIDDIYVPPSSSIVRALWLHSPSHKAVRKAIFPTGVNAISTILGLNLPSSDACLERFALRKNYTSDVSNPSLDPLQRGHGKMIPRPAIILLLKAVKLLSDEANFSESFVDPLTKVIAAAAHQACGAMYFLGLSGSPAWSQQLLGLGNKLFSLQFLKDYCWYSTVHLSRCGSKILKKNGVMTTMEMHVVERTPEKLLNKISDIFSEKRKHVPTKVEFRFEGEAGTGEGPTQELYSEVSNLFKIKNCKLWRDEESPGGLFPPKEMIQPVIFASQSTAPKCHSILKRIGSKKSQCEILPAMPFDFDKAFFVLGSCFARSFVDRFMMNVQLHPAFWFLVSSVCPVAPLAHCSTENLLEVVHLLDPIVYKSIKSLDMASATELESMGFVFRNDTPVTKSNLQEYIYEELVEGIIGRGAISAARSFRRAFDWIIPFDNFQLMFQSTEMDNIFCGSRLTKDGRYFDADELRSIVVADHGYTNDSREVEMFIRVVGGLKGEHQACFIEFLTGSQRLPSGGLRALHKPITVVKKDMESQDSLECTLPSCSTCFLYFKLPSYSSEEIMRKRLLTAILEGSKGFALS